MNIFAIAELVDNRQEQPSVRWLEQYTELLKAAHLAELAGVEMPEPVAYRAINWGHDDAAFVYRDADEPFLNIKSDGLVTLDQCQQAVAAAVARKETK